MVHKGFGADLPNVLIVGAGQAGGLTADALRRHGFIGAITLVGEEEMAPYERPPLSKDILLGKMESRQALLFKDNHWADIAVKFEPGVQAVGIDRSRQAVALQDGRRLFYDTLLIATGARPRRLSALSDNDPRIHYLRTCNDAEKLRAALVPGCRLAILGGGFIGLEVAASARSLGVNVVVIEAMDRPLARLLPRRIADWFEELHSKKGVEIHCGVAIGEVISDGLRLVLSLDNDLSVTVDAVLVGVGAIPNVELAQACGLECRDGIVVGDDCRTSDPNIFAIGDVARHVDPRFACEWRLESWRNAGIQAERAARAVLGMPSLLYETPWFWTDQFGHNVQIAGVPRDGLLMVERGDPYGGPFIAFFLENEVIHGAVAIDAGRDMRLVRDLIRDKTIIDPVRLADSSVRLSNLQARRLS